MKKLLFIFTILYFVLPKDYAHALNWYDQQTWKSVAPSTVSIEGTDTVTEDRYMAGNFHIGTSTFNVNMIFYSTGSIMWGDGTKSTTAAGISGGDMTRATYDADLNGIVDNAELLNSADIINSTNTFTAKNTFSNEVTVSSTIIVDRIGIGVSSSLAEIYISADTPTIRLADTATSAISFLRASSNRGDVGTFFDGDFYLVRNGSQRFQLGSAANVSLVQFSVNYKDIILIGTAGVTFDTGGTLDMKNRRILNIGDSGTDFSVGGGLTLADGLDMSNQEITNIRWANSDDGSGSELDADFLDSFNSTHFVDTTTAQSIAGNKTFTGIIKSSSSFVEMYILSADTATTTIDANIFSSIKGGFQLGEFSNFTLTGSTSTYIGSTTRTFIIHVGASIRHIGGGATTFHIRISKNGTTLVKTEQHRVLSNNDVGVIHCQGIIELATNDNIGLYITTNDGDDIVVDHLMLTASELLK